MTWVRMKDHISGGRHDGRDWPPANGTIDVPDWEAQDLIRGGHAVSAPGEGKGTPVPPEPAAPAAAETEPEAAAGTAEDTGVSPVAEVSPLAEASVTSAGTATAEGAAADAASEPEPPAPSDVKQRWIEHAVRMGEDPETAAAMTKADLMSKYGGRL